MTLGPAARQQPTVKPSRNYCCAAVIPKSKIRSRRGRQAWFRSYMEGRLHKDFESLHAARGDYHSRLRALAPYLAGLSGNLLKYANVANDLELNAISPRTTLRFLNSCSLFAAHPPI